MNSNNETTTVKSSVDFASIFANNFKIQKLVNTFANNFKTQNNLLSGGESEGFAWCVLSNSVGFRCGYVAIPSDHPWYELDYDTLSTHCHCHGGLTFSELSDSYWWIGFDCAHAGDAPDPQLSDRYYRFGFVKDTDVIRDQAYVEAECLRICQQAKHAQDLYIAPAQELNSEYVNDDIKTQLPEGHRVVRQFKVLNHLWELDGFGCVVVDEEGCPYFATTMHGKFWKEDIDFFSNKIKEYTKVIDGTYDAMIYYQQLLINHIKSKTNAN